MKEKPARGRPEVPIDLGALRLLSQVGCTNLEIALHLGVSERTIDNRRRASKIREVMATGYADGNISLRKAQMKAALNGDRTMLIWLGKQRLGQKDKLEHSGAVKTAPPKIYVNFVKPEGESES